jgi:hypothetical protein
MSFIQQKVKIQKKRNNNNGLLSKFAELENKVKNLENNPKNKVGNSNNQPPSVNYEKRIKFLENKVVRLSKKLENVVGKFGNPPSPNSNNTNLLTNIINEDLNKLKIKIEKNENIIKKILFN